MVPERLGHQWSFLLTPKAEGCQNQSGRYIKTKSGNGENEDGKKTV